MVKGEIRIADRAYLQPDRMAKVIEAGADVVIRAGWKSARWLDEDGEMVRSCRRLARRGDPRAGGPADLDQTQGRLTSRLASGRGQEASAGGSEARRKARREAQRGGHQVLKQTLDAADWVIMVTSLKPEDLTTADVLAIYRLRWRIELGFKRLKSLIGLKGPPGIDERSARPHILAHLLTIFCSSRSSTNSRTLPAWPKPPDTTRRLASTPASHRLAASGHHSAAYHRMPAPILRRAPKTSPRAAQTKASISNHGPIILAPMREGGDPYAVCYRSGAGVNAFRNN